MSRTVSRDRPTSPRSSASRSTSASPVRRSPSPRSVSPIRRRRTSSPEYPQRYPLPQSVNELMQSLLSSEESGEEEADGSGIQAEVYILDHHYDVSVSEHAALGTIICQIYEQVTHTERIDRSFVCCLKPLRDESYETIVNIKKKEIIQFGYPKDHLYLVRHLNELRSFISKGYHREIKNTLEELIEYTSVLNYNGDIESYITAVSIAITKNWSKRYIKKWNDRHSNVFRLSFVISKDLSHNFQLYIKSKKRDDYTSLINSYSKSISDAFGYPEIFPFLLPLTVSTKNEEKYKKVNNLKLRPNYYDSIFRIGAIDSGSSVTEWLNMLSKQTLDSKYSNKQIGTAISILDNLNRQIDSYTFPVLLEVAKSVSSLYINLFDIDSMRLVLNESESSSSTESSESD